MNMQFNFLGMNPGPFTRQKMCIWLSVTLTRISYTALCLEWDCIRIRVVDNVNGSEGDLSAVEISNLVIDSSHILSKYFFIANLALQLVIHSSPCIKTSTHYE